MRDSPERTSGVAIEALKAVQSAGQRLQGTSIPEATEGFGGLAVRAHASLANEACEGTQCDRATQKATTCSSAVFIVEAGNRPSASIAIAP